MPSLDGVPGLPAMSATAGDGESSDDEALLTPVFPKRGDGDHKPRSKSATPKLMCPSKKPAKK